MFVPGTEKAEIVFKKALDGHKLTDREIAVQDKDDLSRQAVCPIGMGYATSYRYTA